MEKLYVYEVETMAHVATVNGTDKAACEAKANDLFLGDNSYAYADSAAGLKESDYTLEYKA